MNFNHQRSRVIDFIHSLRHLRDTFWDNNYFYAVGIKIVTVVQFMVLVKLVALNLSLADAGNFFLMYNAALLVSALFFSTHSSAFLRYYSIVSDKFSLYKSVIEQLFIVTSMLMVIIILVYGYYKESIEYPVSLAYAASIGFLLILTTKFRVAGQFKHIFYLTLSQNLILASLVVMCLLFLDLSSELIISCMAISIIFSLIYYAVFKRNSLQRVFQKTSDKKVSRALLLYGFPFVLVAVSNIIISTNGQFMLKHLGYTDEVGVYASNYNIGEKGVFIWLSLVIMVNIPKIYNAYESVGVIAAWRIIKNCMAILGVCGGTLLVFTFFWSRELSVFFTSAEIAELGHWIIPCTVVSAILLGFCSLLAELLLVERKSLTVTYCYVASALISIVLGYFLIGAYGLVGAVLSPIASNLWLLFVLWLCSTRVADC